MFPPVRGLFVITGLEAKPERTTAACRDALTIMRKILFYSFCVGGLVASQGPAAADYKSAEFFKDCNSAIALARGDKGRSAELAGALHCLGFVEAAATGMKSSHELYRLLFPNLREDDLKDERIGKRYVATALLAGLDVCIPERTTVQILVMLIVKRINEDPTSLSSSPWIIINDALARRWSAWLPHEGVVCPVPKKRDAGCANEAASATNQQ